VSLSVYAFIFHSQQLPPTDLSTHNMHSALNPLMEHLDCEQCHEVLRDRIKDVVVQWASVGVSVFLSSSSSDVLFLSSILLVSSSFHLDWRDAFSFFD